MQDGYQNIPTETNTPASTSSWWENFPKSTLDAKTFDLQVLIKFLGDHNQVEIGQGELLTWEATSITVIPNLKELKEFPAFFNPFSGNIENEELKKTWTDCQTEKKPYLIKSVCDGTLVDIESKDAIALTWLHFTPVQAAVAGTSWHDYLFMRMETFVRFSAIQIRGTVKAVEKGA